MKEGWDETKRPKSNAEKNARKEEEEKRNKDQQQRKRVEENTCRKTSGIGSVSHRYSSRTQLLCADTEP